MPLASLRGAAVLSNRASRIVDPCRLCDWPAAIGLLRTSGPDAVIRRVRQAEADLGTAGSLVGFTASDDATAAYIDLSR